MDLRGMTSWLDRQGWYCHACAVGGDVLQSHDFPDMDNLDTPVSQDQEEFPEAFAEQMTLLNPVLLSRAPFLRERKINTASIDSLTDWVERVS